MIMDAFPTLEYTDDINIIDIIRDYRSYIDRVVTKYILIDYTIVGDPTPEYMAYQLYGNPTLFWILIYLNDGIVDPFHGWVKSQEMVFESSIQRYKNMGGIDQILYHMDDDFERYYDLVEYPIGSQNWYHKGDTRHQFIQHVGYLHPVSVYEDEEMINDEKRTIKIIRPNDIEGFINDLGREIERVIRSE